MSSRKQRSLVRYYARQAVKLYHTDYAKKAYSDHKKKEADRRGIESAAILQDKKIYTGRNHTAIHNTMLYEHNISYRVNDSIEGFVNYDGIFFNRQEAMVVALNCGQVRKGKTGHPLLLHSYDLS